MVGTRGENTNSVRARTENRFARYCDRISQFRRSRSRFQVFTARRARARRGSSLSRRFHKNVTYRTSFTRLVATKTRLAEVIVKTDARIRDDKSRRGADGRFVKRSAIAFASCSNSLSQCRIIYTHIRATHSDVRTRRVRKKTVTNKHFLLLLLHQLQLASAYKRGFTHSYNDYLRENLGRKAA